VEDVRVDHRGEQVRGGADRVDVAGEVQVEVLHRDDLRPPRPASAALDPEDRSHRGLAQAQRRVEADACERLRQSDRSRRLALTGLRGGDRGDGDQVPERLVEPALQGLEADLRLVAAVRLVLGLVQAQVGGDVCDRAQRRRLRDLQTRKRGGHGHSLRTGGPHNIRARPRRRCGFAAELAGDGTCRGGAVRDRERSQRVAA
jgi:hypothetical protein